MNKPNNETLARWADMTENNAHSEVLVEIAEWYAKESGFDKFAVALKYVADEHERNGSLTYELMVVRGIVMSAMMKQILDEDEDVFAAVNACL